MERNWLKVTDKSLLWYLRILAASYAPSSLWSHYSMLRATLKVNDGIDITKFVSILPFLKEKSSGFQAKKSKIFTENEILRFLHEADDDKYLLVKVTVS